MSNGASGVGTGRLAGKAGNMAAGKPSGQANGLVFGGFRAGSGEHTYWKCGLGGVSGGALGGVFGGLSWGAS
eukprot:10076348-Lingulodinium_polyedra.AAC.1